jgi:succinyl-CoA synthetase beta subunit
MNLHEYQSNQLFAQYAIPVPKGEVAGSPGEAVAAAQWPLRSGLGHRGRL